MEEISNNQYPTKEEILKNQPEKISDDIRILCDWKEEHYKSWKEKPNTQKLAALKLLIISLSNLYKKSCTIETSNNDFYNPNSKTIFLNLDKPSIISTLHEFAHHIYGSSELKACAYSVWMFKIVFPKVFNKMDFDGHLLKTREHVNNNTNS